MKQFVVVSVTPLHVKPQHPIIFLQYHIMKCFITYMNHSYHHKDKIHIHLTTCPKDIFE